MAEIPELTVQEVAARLGSPGFVVVDNNHVTKWARGHVPGARQLDPGSFRREDLPEDVNTTLVFYCSGPG
ncbi:MAG TPA: rhodanese-like domain-containing protein [Vicinamibacterales bacterium]